MYLKILKQYLFYSKFSIFSYCEQFIGTKYIVTTFKGIETFANLTLEKIFKTEEYLFNTDMLNK